VKIYLDLCAIQRPLDTPNQVRIVLEAEAVLGLIAYCDSGRVKILSSEALLYESEQSSLFVRRQHALPVLAKADEVTQVTEKEKIERQSFYNLGSSPLTRFIWRWQKREEQIICAPVTIDF
jgi:hypothetical protein